MFLPFGYTIDKFRWGLFDGSITAANMNQKWWELRQLYQVIHSFIIHLSLKEETFKIFLFRVWLQLPQEVKNSLMLVPNTT